MTEPVETLWVVLADFRSSHKPTLYPLRVAKRTPKQVKMADRNNELYATVLSVDCIDADKAPTMHDRGARVCTTREKAARAYAVQCSKEQAAVRQALTKAQANQAAAMALLDEETP